MVFVYGAIALGRALLIDLDEEPARYAGISWFDKKLNLFLIAACGISFGGFFLWQSYFGLNSPSFSSIYLSIRAGKVLLLLLVGDVVGIYYYDKYLKKNTTPQHGGSARLTDDEETQEIKKTKISNMDSSSLYCFNYSDEYH